MPLTANLSRRPAGRSAEVEAKSLFESSQTVKGRSSRCGGRGAGNCIWTHELWIGGDDL
jgi:hypothetical protein